MTLRLKYLNFVWLFICCSLGACVEEYNISDKNVNPEESEQIQLRLNVRKEPVVQTRSITDVPSVENKVESIDILIFNSNGTMVFHDQPTVEWTGTEYHIKMFAPASSNGKHTLYLIANHRMPKGTIKTLKDLEDRIYTVNSSGAVVPPFIMVTRKIELTSLTTVQILNAMNSNGNGAFNLERNVAKFTVEVSATNFVLTGIKWYNSPTTASVLLEGSYISPAAHILSHTASSNIPLYLPQIQKMSDNPHEGFHLIIIGKYTGDDYVEKVCYYKIRLFTQNASGGKVPLTSIAGNTHYKIQINKVSKEGHNSENLARQNGFTNDLETVTNLEYQGTHEYREVIQQNGYQLGVECARWEIYSTGKLNTYNLGYLYRCIRDTNLTNKVTFDPDYPNKKRRIIVARTGSTEIFESTVISGDKVDTPVEMYLRFNEKDSRNEYILTSILQYGTIQKKISIGRHPSVTKAYKVLSMENTYSGEVIGGISWMGLAEQRHKGATIREQLESENEQIFLHITENTTGQSREGIVRLFGQNGFYEVHIRQEK